MPQKTKTTPMMAQYESLKSKYSDAFLFFRLGDFYELFNEDATRAAQILEITLTSRNKNADDPIPMCGVPYHSASSYIKVLIEHGYKVAIAEQMEDPKQAKGMVERDVIQVITPGTYMNDEVGMQENNYIAALSHQENWQFAYSDIGTGEVKVTTLTDEDSVITEFSQISANELLVADNVPDAFINQLENVHAFTRSQYDGELTALSTEFKQAITDEGERNILQLLISYVDTIQPHAIDHWQQPEHYEVSHYLHMDYYAKKNLELTQSVLKEKKSGSLLHFLNHTETAMGSRLLKQWLDRPLISKSGIIQRQNQVEALIDYYFSRMEIKEQLHGVYDLERLVAKVAMGTVNPRELIQLKTSLAKLPYLIEELETIDNKSGTWKNILNQLETVPEIVDLIERAINPEDKPQLKDGNVIRDGFNEQLDTYREAMHNGKNWIANLQAEERQKTGINSLKIGYNKVFGYYIEVTKANLHLLEEGRYERKQTLTNAERFITPELKEVENTILEAEEHSLSLEYQLFTQVREQVKEAKASLQRIAQGVAQIDVIQSFAEVSERHQFTRPEILTDKRDIHLVASRHPVVEGVIGKHQFVPNDINMPEDTGILMITGPNMSGKSTYMRQLGLIVIMAQMGLFVPAKEAKLPIFDQIFTRIGAADDLLAGQSTFMVEMMEANHALQQATDNSLLLFDELGRGTSTYDGIALAQAILEYIHANFQCKVLFSTHYHELVTLEEHLPRLKNIHVGATEEDGELVFLHKIFVGPTDKSYGIQVAQLAGLPQSLIQNAQHILIDLENKQDIEDKPEQLPLFKPDVQPVSSELLNNEKEVINDLKSLTLDDMSPREAFRYLDQLVSKLEEE